LVNGGGKCYLNGQLAGMYACALARSSGALALALKRRRASISIIAAGAADRCAER